MPTFSYFDMPDLVKRIFKIKLNNFGHLLTIDSSRPEINARQSPGQNGPMFHVSKLVFIEKAITNT